MYIFSIIAQSALQKQWTQEHRGACTSVEHPEAPHCDLDGLEALPALLRFWGAGKALTTLALRLYLCTYTVVTSARGRQAAQLRRQL